MYICLCNALTDKTLKQAVAAATGQRPDEVYAACGCRIQCGRCVQTVRRLLREHAQRLEGDFQGAD